MSVKVEPGAIASRNLGKERRASTSWAALGDFCSALCSPYLVRTVRDNKGQIPTFLFCNDRTARLETGSEQMRPASPGSLRRISSIAPLRLEMSESLSKDEIRGLKCITVRKQQYQTQLRGQLLQLL